MKILICTQTVDTQHPILGFFHSWLLEFAKQCDSVQVICLREGSHHLPAHVQVHSLGKEDAVSRYRYCMRFYRYIWKYRHDYDVVFVHMNQVYVLLGFPVWFFCQKKIGLWYMHRAVDWSLRLAEKCVNYVFTASPESFRIESQKVHITGHGVPSATFVPETGKKDSDLVTVGRITRSKNLLFLVSMVKQLHTDGHPVSFTIVGGPTTAEEEVYAAELQAHIEKLELQSYVRLVGAVPNTDLPAYLGRAKVFVHAARNGSLDKALLEPLLMGVPVITSAEGAVSLPLDEWQVPEDEQQFAHVVAHTLQTDNVKKLASLRTAVLEQHSLQRLIPKILKIYTTT